jgi:hypothetical protein
MEASTRSMLYLLGLGGLVTFALVVTVEHALQPNLSPRTHEISEYANGDPGWLMVLGFLAWSASLFATATLVAGERPWRRLSFALTRAGCLGLAATGLLMTACFATQTSAGKLPQGVRLGWGGRLHDLGSGLAIIALAAAAVTTAVDGGSSNVFRRCTATILLVALASDAVLLAVGASVGSLRQRILLACAGVWQLLALREWERRRATGAETSFSAELLGRAESRQRGS